jgi:hypothetical protein
MAQDLSYGILPMEILPMEILPMEILPKNLAHPTDGQ